MHYNFCPCNDCICIPICKHKRFNRLMADCSLVDNYLFFEIGHSRARLDRLSNVMDVINPVKWALADNDSIQEVLDGS